VLVSDTDQPPDNGAHGDPSPAELSPVLRAAGDFDRLGRWLGATLTRLQDQLDGLRHKLRGALSPDDRSILGAAIERLQMLQIVEGGLAVGDTLPDFALPDTTGRIVTSDELLAKGPLALTFVRGTWCPYCSIALQALEEARPAIEAMGAELIVVSPMRAGELAQAAGERGLGVALLCDLDGRYARLCGVHYEMSESHAALYERFGLDLDRLNAGAGWALPIPASYVVDRSGVIRFTFGDADWAKRAEPADIVDAVRRIAQAADTAA
jgi:peroxiredoxin